MTTTPSRAAGSAQPATDAAYDAGAAAAAAAAAGAPASARAAGSLRVGVIGMGIMGSAYARNARAAGMAVTGFDTDGARRRQWLDCGGTLAESPAGVLASSDYLIIALSSIAAFEAVMLEPGAPARHARAGQLFIETGTLPLHLKEAARNLLQSRGAAMIDAPVTGTRLHAERRELVVYASGDPQDVERGRPVMEAFARDVRYVGAFGAGLKLKLVTNLLVAVHNVATAEALALAQRAGLDVRLAYELINGGPARSDVFGFRGPIMASGEYGNATMRLDVFDKDLAIIDAFARSVRADTPLFDAGIDVYRAALAQGDPAEDVSAVFRQLTGER